MNIPMDARPAVSTPALGRGGQRLRPLICFEDLFGEEIVDSLLCGRGRHRARQRQQPGWFRQLHGRWTSTCSSRRCALEFQRPVVRSTNTGATAATGPPRSRRPACRPAARGVLEVEVEGREGSTPYARWLAMLAFGR